MAQRHARTVDKGIALMWHVCLVCGSPTLMLRWLSSVRRGLPLKLNNCLTGCMCQAACGKVWLNHTTGKSKDSLARGGPIYAVAKTDQSSDFWSVEKDMYMQTMKAEGFVSARGTVE